jgi:DNA-binding LacI/PurR family transcriptional regulator
MGRMAVTLLLQLLESQKVEGVSVELAIRLVERASTAPPR